jgi:hypothetical protein
MKPMSVAGQYIGNLPALHRLLAYPAPATEKRKPTHSGPRRVRRCMSSPTRFPPITTAVLL